MRRRLVHSSSVRSVGYDLETWTLEVEFASGDVYRYLEVPELVHRQLMASDSVGRFINKRIKPHYKVVDV